MNNESGLFLEFRLFASIVSVDAEILVPDPQECRARQSSTISRPRVFLDEPDRRPLRTRSSTSFRTAPESGQPRGKRASQHGRHNGDREERSQFATIRRRQSSKKKRMPAQAKARRAGPGLPAPLFCYVDADSEASGAAGCQAARLKASSTVLLSLRDTRSRPVTLQKPKRTCAETTP
ncbi:hypothetical protein BDW66DRAFT_114475 [Aspergillus desertorum]